jgi:hypothetical protein
MNELYCSVDIEADGRIPGPSSMLSLGAAMYDWEKRLLGTFSANLKLLPLARPEKDTAEFWAKNQAAYAATRVGLEAPDVAMNRFCDWVESFDGKPVFVGYPAVFDWTWTYWYLINFAGRSPFGFSNAVDIKTYAMATLRQTLRGTSKRTMPPEWFDEAPHTHVAVEDAIEQGALFCNMLKYRLGQP